MLSFAERVDRCWREKRVIVGHCSTRSTKPLRIADDFHGTPGVAAPMSCRRKRIFKAIRMRTSNLIFAAVAVFVIDSSAQAGHFCEHCGCHRNCRKVCRLECGKKKETKIEYGMECEDFCVPGHSKKCGVKVECDCNGHHHRTVIWQPTCAKVHTRKKLVKKEVTKEVPDYKWVVEEYCCVCGQCVKVDRDAKAPRAELSRDRLPLAATTFEGDDLSPDVTSQTHGRLASIAVDIDDEDEPAEATQMEASDEEENATRPAQARRPFLSLFSR
jgi:hypothetical protein